MGSLDMKNKILEAVDSIDQCIFIIDKTMHFVWSNEYTKKIFGGNIIGKRCFKIFNCCKNPCNVCFSEYTLEKGKKQEVCIRTPLKEERSFICESKFFEYDEDGKPSLKIVTFTDITEQKKIEEALREDEEKFRLLSEQSLVGIYILKKGVISYVNKAAADMSGYTQEEMMSWRPNEFSKVIHPDDLNFIMKQYIKKIKGSKDIIPSYEWRSITKTGEIKWVELYSKPISYGKENAIFSVVIDISMRKKIENELLKKSERIQKQQKTIIKLATNISKFKEPFNEYLMSITEAAANTMDVARTSIWLLSEDKTELICDDLYEKETNKHSKGEILLAKEYPKYFKALSESLAINADEAQTDVRTKEFSEDYLKPLGIISMLDSGVRRSGEIIGVICFEHIGNMRSWYDDEISFAAEVADCIMQAIIIEERKKDERSLRVSERKYMDLYEKSLDGIVSCDMQGRFLDCNRSYERMLGYSLAELKDLDYKILTPGKWQEMEEKIVKEKIIAKGYSGLYEKEYIRKDGTIFPVELSSYLMTDDDGRPKGMWGIARDISERKKSRASLKASEEKYRTLIENIPQRIFYKDKQSIYISCNINYANDHNLKPDDIVGKNDYAFYPKETAERYRQEDKKVMSSGMMEHFENDFVSKEGEKIFVHKIKSPVKNAQAEVIGILGVYWDITEQKKTQEIIMQTEKMMSVGGLAAGMAHEINNPLAGILQNAQVLRNRMRGDLDKNKELAEELGLSMDKIKDYLAGRGLLEIIDRIMESGHRASEIVQNMLSFSRKGERHFSYHDIRELIDKIIDLAKNNFDLKLKFDFNDIKIDREYDPYMPKVLCEGGQMQQVIFNLLKNGAEAMMENIDKKGYKPKFVIRVSHFNNMAKFEIQDNGPGMEEKVRKRIFEPFFTTKKVGLGTGLGLSVSYFIVTENHKGTIAVESSMGRGTKFIVNLPLDKS